MSSTPSLGGSGSSSSPSLSLGSSGGSPIPSSPSGAASGSGYKSEIVKSDDGKYSLLLTTPTGKKFRLSKVVVGGREVDLTGANLETYAEQVGKLAKKLLHQVAGDGSAIQDDQKIVVSVTRSTKQQIDADEDEEDPNPQTGSSIAVSLGKENSPEIHVTQEKAVRLFDKVENKTYHILRSQAGAYTVQKQFVEKENIPSETAQRVRRVGVRVLAAALSPVLGAVALGVAVTALVLKGKSVVRGQGAVRKATKQMRKREEARKGEGWRQHLGGTLASQTENQFKKIFRDTKLQIPVFLKAKVGNYLESAFARSGMSKDDIQRHIESFEGYCEGNGRPITAADCTSPEALRTFLRGAFKGEEHLLEALSNREIEAIVQESQLWTKNDVAFNAQIAEDARVWKEFTNAVKEVALHQNNPAKYNTEMLEKFRAVLATPTYQAIKDEPLNPLTAEIGAFAVANWNGASVMDAYHNLGKHLQEGVADNFQLQTPEGRDGFTTAIERGYHKAESENLTDHGIAKLLYGVTHPEQMLASTASMAVTGGMAQSISGAFGVYEYDPALAGNTSSFQGTVLSNVVDETGQAKQVRIDNCYGGSPTIGGRIAPEMLAALQAIRNNNRRRKLESEGKTYPDGTPVRANPKIPGALVYTNLQNINDKGGEGERSFAIMQLQTLFPNEFAGLTLAKDSKFYEGEGVHKKPWKGVEDFGQHMQDVLSAKECYTFLDRGGKPGGEGIYLPYGQEAWRSVLPNIFACANHVLRDVIPANDPNNPVKVQEYRYAYQELVYFLIQSYVEEKEGLKAPGNFIMTMKACKENVDRGGAENGKHGYLLLPSDQNRLALISGLLMSRPLATRDRVLIHNRMVPILAFMKHVSPAVIQAVLPVFLNQTLKVHVQEHAFTPAISRGSNEGDSPELEAITTPQHTRERSSIAEDDKEEDDADLDVGRTQVPKSSVHRVAERATGGEDIRMELEAVSDSRLGSRKTIFKVDVADEGSVNDSGEEGLDDDIEDAVFQPRRSLEAEQKAAVGTGLSDSDNEGEDLWLDTATKAHDIFTEPSDEFVSQLDLEEGPPPVRTPEPAVTNREGAQGQEEVDILGQNDDWGPTKYVLGITDYLKNGTPFSFRIEARKKSGGDASAVPGERAIEKGGETYYVSDAEYKSKYGEAAAKSLSRVVERGRLNVQVMRGQGDGGLNLYARVDNIIDGNKKGESLGILTVFDNEKCEGTSLSPTMSVKVSLHKPNGRGYEQVGRVFVAKKDLDEALKQARALQEARRKRDELDPETRREIEGWLN